MSQICIARAENDVGSLLADAETFMNALRLKPEGSLADVLEQAPGIQVLQAEGEGMRVRTSAVRAIDVLASPTEITISAGNAAPRTITLLPENGMIDDIISAALKTGPGPAGPAGARPSSDPSSDKGMKG